MTPGTCRPPAWITAAIMLFVVLRAAARSHFHPEAPIPWVSGILVWSGIDRGLLALAGIARAWRFRREEPR